MSTDLSEYSRVLAEQLRLNGMKEEQVREVVAEVQHHVIATQQDPVEAFGQPTDYAMTWIRPKSGRWVMRIAAATAGVTGLLALTKGLGPGPWSGRVDIDWSSVILWLTMVVCVGVMPWTVEVWLARRRGQRVGTPEGVPVWGMLVAIALSTAAVIWGIASMLTDEGGVLFSAPKWVLVLIGFVCLPGLAFIGSHRNASLPADPGTPVTWKTRLRRAFINT